MNNLKKKNDFDFNDFKESIYKVGLKKNDSIFLSTNLGILGVPKTTNTNYLLTTSRWLIKSVQSIIGKNGNIFVPTYSYSFTKKKRIYNPLTTKADIGYFPNFFLKQPKVVRSLDPMMSIAGIGPNCEEVLLKISNNSFGKNCALERLFKIKNLKCCHIGLSYNWLPFMHYLDWKNNVPFRFDKKFYGYIKVNNMKKKVEWTYYARILRDETFSNGYKIGLKALQKKLYSYSELGKSMIYLIDYKKFYKFSCSLTRNNKWLTVNGPKFKI